VPYLAMVDVFSGFPFLYPCKSADAASLVVAARAVFLQTGLPRVFMSDGGTPFMSEAFQSFLRFAGVRHRVSTPQYPQSNGAAERAVRTLKTLRMKTGSPDEFFRALLEYQNTPRGSRHLSPADVFFGRSQRSWSNPCPRPVPVSWADRVRDIGQNQRVMQRQHGFTRTVARTLQPGERVLLKDFFGKPVVVTVEGYGAAPRSYRVSLPSGVITERNHRFLFPLPRSVPVTPETPRLGLRQPMARPVVMPGPRRNSSMQPPMMPARMPRTAPGTVNHRPPDALPSPQLRTTMPTISRLGRASPSATPAPVRPPRSVRGPVCSGPPDAFPPSSPRLQRPMTVTGPRSTPPPRPRMTNGTGPRSETPTGPLPIATATPPTSAVRTSNPSPPRPPNLTPGPPSPPVTKRGRRPRARPVPSVGERVGRRTVALSLRAREALASGSSNPYAIYTSRIPTARPQPAPRDRRNRQPTAPSPRPTPDPAPPRSPRRTTPDPEQTEPRPGVPNTSP
jgi:transposase InsO family protein